MRCTRLDAPLACPRMLVLEGSVEGGRRERGFRKEGIDLSFESLMEVELVVVCSSVDQREFPSQMKATCLGSMVG